MWNIGDKRYVIFPEGIVQGKIISEGVYTHTYVVEFCTEIDLLGNNIGMVVNHSLMTRDEAFKLQNLTIIEEEV